MRNLHLSRSVGDLRASLAESRVRGRIGLVPTMGAFHEGHLSLMRQARSECDVVVVSLFVNPAQFNEAGDLAAYPRDEQRDLALAAQQRVDFVFAPSAETIYPNEFATTVAVGGVTESLEGAHRGRAHFDGVTTIVAKLLNIVSPDVVYFGQKDAQQAVVIRRMVADLEFPVLVEVCPTVREPDGLALSSRNIRLSPEERGRATALHRSLSRATKLARDGEREASAILAAARTELDGASIDPDYLELVDAETLAPVARLNGRPALAVVAARVGDTRLIDNELLGGD
ncbi:MAG TPA: pantoate--beta-alanine ligase [Solirubrobacteraceae bacterium]